MYVTFHFSRVGTYISDTHTYTFSARSVCLVGDLWRPLSICSAYEIKVAQHIPQVYFYSASGEKRRHRVSINLFAWNNGAAILQVGE